MQTRRIDSDGASSNAVRTSDIQALAKALPTGAAQVEDILISGCYSGGKDQLAAFKTAFPNLRSAMGYGIQGKFEKVDQSPTGANAVRHIQEWEKETRGRGLPTGARSALEHVVGAENISVLAGSYQPARKP